MNPYHSDSTFDTGDEQSQISVTSSIYRGIFEYGRRYQSLRSDYYIPSDEQQFESYAAGHLVALAIGSEQKNGLFSSPLCNSPKRVLDIGTGNGVWAMDVADSYPNAIVRGVDLYPPPVAWVPPNCILEVDDILNEWTWQEKFDLIHMRHTLGSFSAWEWNSVYKKCFKNLRSCGWFEQVEMSFHVETDDDSLPVHSALRGFGAIIDSCGDKAGRPLKTSGTAECLRQTGFQNVHEKVYKWPIGTWPQDPCLRDAGVLNLYHWLEGLEGWCMWLLTRFGEPQPWTQDEVRVFVAQLRKELQDPRYHVWHKVRRFWAQKSPR